MRPLAAWRSSAVPRPQSSSGPRRSSTAAAQLAPAAAAEAGQPTAFPFPPAGGRLALGSWDGRPDDSSDDAETFSPRPPPTAHRTARRTLRPDVEYDALVAAERAAEARLSRADAALLLRVSTSFLRPLALRPASAAASLGGAAEWSWAAEGAGEASYAHRYRGAARPGLRTAPADGAHRRSGSRSSFSGAAAPAMRPAEAAATDDRLRPTPPRPATAQPRLPMPARASRAAAGAMGGEMDRRPLTARGAGAGAS